MRARNIRARLRRSRERQGTLRELTGRLAGGARIKWQEDPPPGPGQSIWDAPRYMLHVWIDDGALHGRHPWNPSIADGAHEVARFAAAAIRQDAETRARQRLGMPCELDAPLAFVRARRA